jgi:hypothetical protein
LALASHAAPRDLVQFLMNERNQAIEGRLVALPPFEKETGDFRRMGRNTIILSPFRGVQGLAAVSRFPDRRNSHDE